MIIFQFSTNSKTEEKKHAWPGKKCPFDALFFAHSRAKTPSATIIKRSKLRETSSFQWTFFFFSFNLSRARLENRAFSTFEKITRCPYRCKSPPPNHRLVHKCIAPTSAKRTLVEEVYSVVRRQNKKRLVVFTMRHLLSNLNVCINYTCNSEATTHRARARSATGWECEEWTILPPSPSSPLVCTTSWKCKKKVKIM